MTTDAAFTDDSGQSLTVRLATFLRQDFAVIAAGGWPRNPPSIMAFTEAAYSPGSPIHRLGRIVDAVAIDTLGPICLGVVDLDVPPGPNTGTYQFAGWGLDTQTTVGSCAKTWAMYAAFQLRDDVRSFLRTASGVARSNIATKLRTAWRNSPIPELKKIARDGRMPRIEQIFDFSALPADPAAASAAPAPDPNAVDFAGIAACGVPAGFAPSAATSSLASQLETFHQHEYSSKRADKVDMWEKLATMPFGQRLWLTTAWSDNAAATTCATDIGFDYIDAVMRASHLYDPAANAGARLALTYADSTDLLDAGTWARGTALFQRISNFRGLSQGAAPRHAATVRSLLCFAAALDARTLISAADSDQMVALMRPLRWATGERGQAMPAFGLDGNPILDDDGSSEHVDGVDSFILSAFDEFVDDASIGLHVGDSWRPFRDAAAKIGILGNKLADVALVTIDTTDGRTLHWGIAFVGNRCDNEDDRFKPGSNQYGTALKEIVRQWLAP